jgi:galactose oxidase
MPDLGNAWHLPTVSDPRGRSGMRVPSGPVVAGTHLSLITGNQFQGPGNPGNQLQVGSAAFVRTAGAAGFTEVPLTFLLQDGNNKYFQATWQVPEDAQPGDVVEYYLRVRYSDHDDTFLLPADLGTTTGDEAVAQANPFRITLSEAATVGRWGPVVTLPNVAIHATVLPNGLVLMWGRRDDPLDRSLGNVASTPFVWDPVSGTAVGPTAVPADGATRVNLFCSGHAFLADGALLVVGGHLEDSEGTTTAFRYSYDPAGGVGTWTALTPMARGRWYPTATTLPDGSVLVLSGSYRDGVEADGTPRWPINRAPQVWKNGAWIDLNAMPGGVAPELYPRLHVRGDGSVFQSGPAALSRILTLPGGGTWAPENEADGELRDGKLRDYAPSVEFAPGRIVYMGGGTEKDVFTPNADVEVAELRVAKPWWRDGTSLSTPRRQHNATVLPDGTVLVTGGTRGAGSGDPQDPVGRPFNDLRAGQPVHDAELWDPGPDPGPLPKPADVRALPQVGTRTQLAAEDEDRCYHSTAVLLPDGRVLSAGGGDYRPFNGVGNRPNAAVDSHRTGQVFSPPYLFRGPQPEITAAPAAVVYRQTFPVEVDRPDGIARVTWLRPSSVTHSINMTQRFTELAFSVQGGVLQVTAPDSPLASPPGPHMLFVLDDLGVPSVAAFVRLDPPVGQVIGAPDAEPAWLRVPTATPGAPVAYDTRAPLPPGTLRAVVGLTGTCPYGLAACWGGADQALRGLDGVVGVGRVPDTSTSTAVVHLADGRLPALDRWPGQFAASVNGSYVLRGVEVELTGQVRADGDGLVLDSGDPRPAVRLARLGPADKVQWDNAAGTPVAATEAERAAYGQLGAGTAATVVGPLERTADGYALKVREVAAPA